MAQRHPTLFALAASAELGGRVASALELPLGRHEEREFEDGEHKARPLFVEHLVPRFGERPVVMVSPDSGGVERAELLRQDLAAALGRAVGLAVVEKTRSEGVVAWDRLFGEVEGAKAVIVDDPVSSGATLARAARACRRAGAVRVGALATHGLFVGGAGELFVEPALEEIVVTDTVEAWRVPRELREKLTVLGAAELLAAAIRRVWRASAPTPSRRRPATGRPARERPSGRPSVR